MADLTLFFKDSSSKGVSSFILSAFLHEYTESSLGIYSHDVCPPVKSWQKSVNIEILQCYVKKA